MTLTGELGRGDSFARRFVDEHFPALKAISRECNRVLSLLPLVTPVHEERVLAMLAGTAADYRVRAFFTKDFHRSAVIERGLWVLGAVHSNDRALNPWHRGRGRPLGETFVGALESFLAGCRPERRPLPAEEEDRLCRYCVMLAYLDFIGRAPMGTSALDILFTIGRPDIDGMISDLDRNVVDDVAGLSRLFYTQHRELVSGFGRLPGSADVGGADFDLVVDGCLIDLKSGIKAKIPTAELRQLIGYWLLDYKDELCIDSVAIILLRHGRIQRFKVEELMPAGTSAAAVRAEFREGIKRKTGDDSKVG